MSNPHEDGHLEPAPPVRDDESAEIPRPKAIDTAFQASLAGAAIGAIATVVTVLFDSEGLALLVRDMLSGAGLPDGDAEVAQAVGTFRVAMVLGILVFLGLSLLFALKMRAGRNWARILITVLAFVGVVGFLNAMAASGAALELIWSLAEVAFAVTAVIYMFRPESTRYFVEHKKRRLARRGFRA
ncbi:hypothetical protein [Actinophytocola gossypii]|uniref:DUF2127 domain-containing protein n=1 Tax=Actinophytocola gossypii TaxID=2812003 RepID=A0ABT2JCR5_9PSEU|nr:hypothetical protein [Actinophytocola gossypii]MCT2585659.1 hypothetical protein [Actinophytocola gossypii]